MLGKKENPSKLFTTVSLEALVPEDNIYRRLDAILDLRYLYSECGKFYGKTGNPSIDPVVFFKIILYGYYENIISDRELIRALSDSLGGRLFIGYDLDEKLPNHSSISRTRKLLGEELFEKLFTQVVEKCVKSGLVSGTHQSIDSTLVKANASLDSLARKEAKLEIKTYIEMSKEQNETEEKSLQSSDEKRTEEGRKKKSSKNRNEIYRSTTDPESRVASKPGTKTEMYYKTQISVDSQKNVITEVNTYTADETDIETLIETVDRTTKRLETMGEKVISVGADNGYVSGENLSELEKRGIASYMPLRRPADRNGLYDLSAFKYDEENDCLTCPNGNKLTYRRLDSKKKSKIYSGRTKECSQCPLRSKCTTSTAPRHVKMSIYWKEYERLENRMKTQAGRRAMRIRKTGPEPVFGHGKEHHGLRKYMTKGLDKAKKNSYIIASVLNLKKLIKYSRRLKTGMVIPVINKIKSSNYAIGSISFDIISVKAIELKYQVGMSFNN
jgi:transposase